MRKNKYFIICKYGNKIVAFGPEYSTDAETAMCDYFDGTGIAYDDDYLDDDGEFDWDNLTRYVWEVDEAEDLPTTDAEAKKFLRDYVKTVDLEEAKKRRSEKCGPRKLKEAVGPVEATKWEIQYYDGRTIPTTDFDSAYKEAEDMSNIKNIFAVDGDYPYWTEEEGLFDLHDGRVCSEYSCTEEDEEDLEWDELDWPLVDDDDDEDWVNPDDYLDDDGDYEDVEDPDFYVSVEDLDSGTTYNERGFDTWEKAIDYYNSVRDMSKYNNLNVEVTVHDPKYEEYQSYKLLHGVYVDDEEE